MRDTFVYLYFMLWPVGTDKQTYDSYRVAALLKSKKYLIIT